MRTKPADPSSVYLSQATEQLALIHALLDERLPKPDDTTARYEREDTEARQDDPKPEPSGWPARPEQAPTEEGDPCICASCQPGYRLMRVCGICGCKRCPGAADHRNTCTGSNEPGQPGSLYADPPTHQEPDMTEADRSAGDPDEALAKVLCDVDRGAWEVDSSRYLRNARAARQHLAATGGAPNATRLEVERNLLLNERDTLRHALGEEREIAREVEQERDGWKAKHAALREDVEGMRERWLHDGVMLTHFDRILDRDDERAKGEQR